MRAPLLFLPAIIALAATLISCGDAEEVAPAATAPGVPTAASPRSASPAPASATSIPAPAPTGWKEYTDPQLQFSLPARAGLLISEWSYDTHENKGCPPVQVRVVTLKTTDGNGVLGVSRAPNPCKLSLEEWIREYPGWPCEAGASPTCEPAEVTVAGERGIRFSINALGDPTATIYFARGDAMYGLSGGVYRSPEAGYGPTMTEDEFQAVIRAFRFLQPG